MFVRINLVSNRWMIKDEPMNPSMNTAWLHFSMMIQRQDFQPKLDTRDPEKDKNNLQGSRAPKGKKNFQPLIFQGKQLVSLRVVSLATKAVAFHQVLHLPIASPGSKVGFQNKADRFT